MRILERLREHRESLRQQRDSGGEQKGSILFWYYVVTIAIQLIQLFRAWSQK